MGVLLFSMQDNGLPGFRRLVDGRDHFLGLECFFGGDVRLDTGSQAFIEILDLLDMGHTPVRAWGLPGDRHGHRLANDTPLDNV